MGAARVSAPFGSLSADAESADYAVACRARAQACLRSREKDIEGLESWISNLRTNNRFRRLDDEFGHPFRDWQHFCVTKQPYGLGYSPEAIDALLNERKTAQSLAADPAVTAELGHGGARAGAGRTPNEDESPDNQEAIGHLNRPGSNSAERLVRRLKRDAPEIAEELARGELPSARAAAIKAGIVKVPTLVQQALRLTERMAATERVAFSERFIPLLRAAEEELNR